MSDHGSTSRRRRRSSSEASWEHRDEAASSRESDPGEVARAVILRQLTAGPRTRRQLADALTRRGLDDDVIERTLDRFEELQLIDDEAFAQAWVETRHHGRGLSRRALAHELRHRGVADDTVRGAVEEISPEEEFAAARKLVRAKLAATRGDEPGRRLRRLAGLLARKGYGAGVAMSAVREELRAEGSDERDATLDLATLDLATLDPGEGLDDTLDDTVGLERRAGD